MLVCTFCGAGVHFYRAGVLCLRHPRCGRQEMTHKWGFHAPEAPGFGQATCWALASWCLSRQQTKTWSSGDKSVLLCVLSLRGKRGRRRCVQGRWCESTIPNPNTEVRGNGAYQWAQARNPATPFVSRGVSRVFIPVCWGLSKNGVLGGLPVPTVPD